MQFTQTQEKQIQQFMKSLDLSREEAIDLLLEDLEVDKMKSSKEIESDLTEEQKEGIKQNTKERSGKYEKSAEALAAEEAKRQAKKSALEALMQAVEVAEVVKADKEFIFKVDSVKYRCTITRVRKQDA